VPFQVVSHSLRVMAITINSLVAVIWGRLLILLRLLCQIIFIRETRLSLRVSPDIYFWIYLIALRPLTPLMIILWLYFRDIRIFIISLLLVKVPHPQSYILCGMRQFVVYTYMYIFKTLDFSLIPVTFWDILWLLLRLDILTFFIASLLLLHIPI
jgi:hypothetical protein